MDNFNLLSDEGWKVFESSRAFPAAARPPHIGKASTPQEIEVYLRRAGFHEINLRENGTWIQGWAVNLDSSMLAKGEELQERIGAFEGQAAGRDAQIDSLAQTVAKRDAQIRAIYASTSWRLSAPIRWVGIQRFRARTFFARVRQQHRS